MGTPELSCHVIEPVRIGCGDRLDGHLLAWLRSVHSQVPGVCWPGGMWAADPPRWRVLAALGALVALDDVVEHALGVWTPLDAVWKAVIYPALP
jgi:hypothetical protein